MAQSQKLTNHVPRNGGHYVPVILIGLVVISAVSMIGFTIYSDVKNKSNNQRSTVASTTPNDSGIVGSASLGPTEPVCHVGVSCSETYAHSYTVTIDEADNQQEVTTTQANNSGQFKVNLPAGKYTILASTGKTFPAAPPTSATVQAHMYTNVVIQFDTGIR